MAEPRDVYTYADLVEWPERTGALQPPARFAVFGDPVAHSRSPQMHNPALAERDAGAQYVRLRIQPGELAPALALLPARGFLGVNLTIPHKVAALTLVDRLTDTARHLGTVNTVRVEPDGTLTGHNSDGPGLSRAIGEAFGASFSSQRLLILGAGGGAGRAAAIQAAMEGCPAITLVNRTRAKAEATAAEITALRSGLSVSIADGSPASLRAVMPRVDLVLNASSVGMKPGDPELMPGDAFTPAHCVYDMVYAPPRTPLLEQAAAAGARVANGLAMLLWQGAISFEYWLGRPAPVEAMRQGLGLPAPRP